MALEINLLTVKKPLSANVLKIKNKLTLIAVIFLISFIVIGIAVLVITIILGRNKASLNTRIDAATSQIIAEKSTESLYIAYINKLNALEVIIGKRVDANNLYKKLKKNIPEGVTLTSYSASQDSIDINTQINDLETIDKFLEILRTQKDISFKEITVGGIMKDKDSSVYKIPYNLLLNTDQK